MFHTFYQFRETTQNNFVCIFAFFQFRKMIKTQQNSELYRTASRFAKLKKHTKLSTLVRIRFLPANYSKFVYMYFLCLLYAVRNVSVVIPSQSVSFVWQWKMRYLTLSQTEKAANPNWDESIYPSYPSERWGQILA